jgi:hypothetical protein
MTDQNNQKEEFLNFKKDLLNSLSQSKRKEGRKERRKEGKERRKVTYKNEESL